MNAMLAERIVADPKSEFASPLVRDTGITVTQILDALAQHPEASEVIRLYPALELEDVQASIEFAREAVEPTDHLSGSRPISDLGWTPEQAAEVRRRLLPFAEDWDDPAMDIYDATPPAG